MIRKLRSRLGGGHPSPVPCCTKLFPEIEFLPVCLSYLPTNLDVRDSRTTLDTKRDGSSNPSIDAKFFFPINLCTLILRAAFQLRRTSSNRCSALQRILEFRLAVPNVTLQAVPTSIKLASQFPAAESKAAKCQLGTWSSLANWPAAEQIGQALSMTKQHWAQQRATHKEIAWKCNGGEDPQGNRSQRALLSPRDLSIHKSHTKGSKVVLKTHRWCWDSNKSKNLTNGLIFNRFRSLLRKICDGGAVQNTGDRCLIITLLIFLLLSGYSPFP